VPESARPCDPNAVDGDAVPASQILDDDLIRSDVHQGVAA
jgi:hypothetical protein